MSDTPAGQDEDLATVVAILSRKTRLDALASLASAIQFKLPETTPEKTVIALDANVILRINNHDRSDDIIDSLRTKFLGHIVLPGQVIQEFWNNQFQAIQTKSADIEKKFSELSRSIEGIDDRFDSFSEKFKGLTVEFRSSFGYLFDKKTLKKTESLMIMLTERARVPFAPRLELLDISEYRRRTKTPPGFKDDSDGDFYVWADLLMGLMEIRRENIHIDRVTMVTGEKKIDWNKDGVPHPILTSEVYAICGAAFEIITVDTLAKRLLD